MLKKIGSLALTLIGCGCSTQLSVPSGSDLSAPQACVQIKAECRTLDTLQTGSVQESRSWMLSTIEQYSSCRNTALDCSSEILRRTLKESK